MSEAPGRSEAGAVPDCMVCEFGTALFSYEVCEACGYEAPSIDKSECPYFRRGLPGADPHGICSFGCRDEPSCMTDRPAGGWPGEASISRTSVSTGPKESSDG